MDLEVAPFDHKYPSEGDEVRVTGEPGQTFKELLEDMVGIAGGATT